MPADVAPLPAALRTKLDELARQHADLTRQLEDPSTLADHTKVRDLSIRKAALDEVVGGYARYRALLAEASEYRTAIASGDDPELAELARDEAPRLEARASVEIERVKAALVNSDDRRVGSIILEVRAGAGGDEAGLWARDLLNMYERYALARSWQWETLDAQADAGVGGVRHAVVNIRGPGVFAELAFEAGVHSVKRVPATETQGRIHTSTATVAVLPEPEAVEIRIDWAKDVEEHVTTSQGPGGQNVNKVATAVHLVHLPTGIEVRMQESKSQHQNRDKARRLLAARVAEVERQRADAERAGARKAQIGTGERSEKVRVYRYQDDITADQRLSVKFKTAATLSGDLAPIVDALMEQETARRLSEL